HTPAYSVLFPPLAWAVGPAVAGVLAALAAAAAFEPLARGHFGPGARWGTLWFGVATSTVLFTGRLPYALGVAFALGSLLALQRGRTVWAVGLAILSPLGSPVAGAFLALAAVAVALTGERDDRRGALLVAGAGIVPTILLAAAFPEGGSQPYAFLAFLPAPVRAVLNGEDDQSRYRAYYRPLVDYLQDNSQPPGRVEVVFTDAHWESADVAIHVPIARGWERQLDIGRNSLFYSGTLNATTYRQWLDDNAVRWVALPDAKLDYSGRREARLVRGGLPYLKLSWTGPHWRVYEVTSPHSLVTPEGAARIRALSLGAEQVRLAVDRTGSALVKVRWTPYWVAKGACVARDGDWTRVTARRTGTIRLRIDFSPLRVFERGRRCA